MIRSDALYVPRCTETWSDLYITNPKHQAAICNKIFNVFSHYSRGTFSVSSCSLRSLWLGLERNPGKRYTLRYIFYYAPETPLMSSQPKFLISLPCTWLLLGAFVAFEWNRNWDANWCDISFLLCKIFLCSLIQSCKVTRSKKFGFNASKKQNKTHTKKQVAGKGKC